MKKYTFITLVMLCLVSLSYGQVTSGQVSTMADDDGGGGPPPPTPSTPTVSTNTCGDKIVTKSGTPPAGVVWYWQTTANGTSISNSSATYTVSAQGATTVYLRAVKTASGVWSTLSASVSFTVNPYPGQPVAPTVDNQCGQTILTRGTPPATPTGNTWYWQGTDPNGVTVTNSAQTYTVTTPGTYYLRAKSTAGCWSTSVGVVVTIRSKPATPNTPSKTANTCGVVTLTFNGAPTGNVRWYWQTSSTGTSTILGYTSPYNVSTSATYYLRGYDTVGDCWSDASSGGVVVTYNPAVGNPTASGVTRSEPGLVDLSASLGANGTGIKWYSEATNGTLLSTSSTYSTPVSGTTTFYVTSYNATTGCETATRLPVLATVTPMPVVAYTNLYIIMGNSVTLSVPNNTYTTYAWTRDGVAVGSTPTIAVTTAGSYTVTVTKNDMTGSGVSAVVPLTAINMNSITVNNIQKEGVTLATSVESLAVNERVKSVQYTGGLGNTIQTISAKASPLQKDIVAPVEYDVLGRQLKSYLPYVSSANDGLYRVSALNNGGYTNSEQYLFYQTSNKTATDTKPFTITDVETSPLGRALSQTGMGSAWHTPSKKVTQQFLVNRSTDAVRIWTVNTAGMPVSTATYPNYELHARITTDENGNRVKVYIDKLGRVVLKEVEANATTWLKTYQIYDDKGRLAYTLTPEGTKAGNFSPNQAFLDQWAFQYRYDNLNRLVEYRAPAGGWSYTVYDVLNRPVLTQNEDQRSRSEWAFIKYDVHRRPIVTGYKVIASSTRASVQASVDAQSYLYELTNNNSVGYTLTRTYPSSVEIDLLSINYYDNYTFLAYTGWDAEALNYAFVAEQGSTGYEGLVFGLSTGAKIRVMNTNMSTAKWLNAVQYYDKYYRPLQVKAENHLGGLDRNTNKYNNLRQLIETRLAHHNESVTVLKKFNYDHMGRITKIFQNINGATADQLVSQYEYNELGQLVDKKLHNTTGTSFLQSVDYRYNIRGWISSINNSQLNVNASNNDEANDYFGMEFLYSAVETGLSNTPSFNGNISAAKWKGFGMGIDVRDQKSYKYTYDRSDRLLAATSQVVADSTWTKEPDAQNETITYDHNGNIRTLARNHRKHQLSGTVSSYVTEAVDNLTYTYAASQGNRLAKVEDAVPVATGTGDFKNNANVTTEYTYNADGNLTADKNKGIDSVHYNLQGKVRRVKFSDGRAITYIYDAGGNKLKMRTYQGSALQTTTDYVGGFVYENAVLSFFGSPEGRVVKNGANFEYQYSIADDQGNTRVVFTSATPAPDAPVATFEGDGNDGTSQFQNIVTTNIMNSIPANHTPGGGKAIRMNQTYKIGPSRALKVYPGDKVDIEVWEYHEGDSGYGTTSAPLTTLVSMVAGAFGGVSGAPGDPGLIYSGVNSALNGWVPPGNQGSGRPAAYINYILFDKNYKVVNMGWELAPATTFTKHKLSFSTLDIKEAGFIFVYLSYDNDSNNWVYFDDMKVTHTKSNVIQYNEYYPFGLQASTSWTRENSANNFLYNSGSELNQTSGWYETFFRGYDPALGRFSQVDPMAYASSSHSPYDYGFNNPVVYNDPNGDYPEPTYIDPQKKGGGGGFGSWVGGGGSGFDNYVAQLFGGSTDWMNPGGSVMIGTDDFIKNALRGTRFGGAWSDGKGHYFTGPEAMAVANSYQFEEYFYVDYSTEILIGELWQGATVVKGARLAQQGYQWEWVTTWTGQNNIISSTSEAKQFYEAGDGSARLIDQNSSMMVVNSPEFQRVISRLVSGKANRISSSFDVDMTSKVFHIGNTNVDYQTTILGSNAYTVFTLFARDGFWDPNFVAEALGVVPDGMGPNLETEGSHPYPYVPVVLVLKFANPGTYGK